MELNRYDVTKTSVPSLYKALEILVEKIPSTVTWAGDGNLALALQDMNVAPHDNDIMTGADEACSGKRMRNHSRNMKRFWGGGHCRSSSTFRI